MHLLFVLPQVAALLTFSVTSAAQQPAVNAAKQLPPGAIDGSEHPEQIPDNVAYRLVLLHLSVPVNPTQEHLTNQHAKFGVLHLPDADRQALKNVLQAFRSDWSSMENAYKSAVNQGVPDVNLRSTQEAIVQRARDQLGAQLSPGAKQVFDEFVIGEKTNMIIVPMPSNMQHNMGSVTMK